MPAIDNSYSNQLQRSQTKTAISNYISTRESQISNIQSKLSTMTDVFEARRTESLIASLKQDVSNYQQKLGSL